MLGPDEFRRQVDALGRQHQRGILEQRFHRRQRARRHLVGGDGGIGDVDDGDRSEEHTSELQSLMRISYAVFCLKKKITTQYHSSTHIRKNNAYSTSRHNKILTF